MDKKYWCYVTRKFIKDEDVHHILPDVAFSNFVRILNHLPDYTSICISKEVYRYEKWVNVNSNACNLICPYCGVSIYPTQPYPDNCTDGACPNCDKVYDMSIKITRTYTTKKKEGFEEYIKMIEENNDDD